MKKAIALLLGVVALWVWAQAPATLQPPTALTLSPMAFSNDPLLAGFAKSTVASVADAVDQVCGKRGYLSHDMRPRTGGPFVGRAVTAAGRQTTADKATPALATKHSVEMIDNAKPGEVGVIVLENGLDVAAMGGLMGTAAKARGMAGMILDGGLRDVEEVQRLGLSVFSRSVTPATAVSRWATVAYNVPVECAGVTIAPGDIIVAGQDGVVAVPAAQAAAVLKRAQEIDERETKMVPHILEQRSLSKVIQIFNRI